MLTIPTHPVNPSPRIWYGGTLETAAQIAGHASTGTTQLYNRSREALSLDEIERIRI